MHQFIFSSGEWLGQGQLTFSDSPNKMYFYTKWQITEAANGVILCQQFIERQGIESDLLINLYRFSNINEGIFDIALESELLGSVQGKGKYTNALISWEFMTPMSFNDTSGFKGIEEYQIEEKGGYLLKAVYDSEGHLTMVNGQIWKKHS